MDYLDAHLSDSPQILVGDFNLKRSNPEAHLLIERRPMRDAWAVLHPDAEGNTFPSWEVNERLDRIYYRNVADPALCEISGFAQSSQTWPSDHCALFADFLL